MSKYVRYLHGTPDIGTVNILDGEVPVVRDLRFGLITPYLFAEKPEGFHLEEESGLSGWRMMRQNMEQMTTWVLTGEEGRPLRVPVEDPDVSIPEAAGLRLGTFGKEDVDLYMGSLAEKQEELLSHVEPGEVTEYQTIQPGRYFMDLRPAGNPDEVLARIPNLMLRRNVLYTLYVIGNENQWKTILTVDGASYLPWPSEINR